MNGTHLLTHLNAKFSLTHKINGIFALKHAKKYVKMDVVGLDQNDIHVFFFMAVGQSPFATSSVGTKVAFFTKTHKSLCVMIVKNRE